MDPRRPAHFLSAFGLALAIASASGFVRASADQLIADFEGSDLGDWTATGTAFGEAPAKGMLPEQAPVGGFRGNGFVSSFHGGDKAMGTLDRKSVV